MNAVILYCRPGFEKECAAEIQEKAALHQVFGYVTLMKKQGVVYYHLYDDMSTELFSRLKLSELIFTRQWFYAFAEIELPVSDRVSAIIDVLSQDEQFADLRMETLDTNEGKSLSKLARKLAVPLRQTMRQQNLLHKQGSRQGNNCHVLLLDGNKALVGWSAGNNSSPFPMGVMRLKFPSQAPSRSTLKLDEAFLTFIPAKERAERLQSGLNAVDLGASPGGWTYQLVRRGMMVTAIDNGPMAESLMETGQVKHLQVDGFKYQPSKKNVYWLVCDMVEKPQRVAWLMCQWLLRGDCKEAIFNLKLPMKNRYQQIQQNLQTMTEAFEQHQVKYQVSAKHLYYDREEITVHARLLSQPIYMPV